MGHDFPLAFRVGEPIAYLNLQRQHGSRHGVAPCAARVLAGRGADFTLFRFIR
jgi:hypothetical protein